ncbi:hypothetical protein [Catenulispora acidiphila]|nr:hypothetical protein [Catenulispora acidiphila]
MPDPKDSQTLIAQGSGVNPDSPVFKKAMTACTQYLPNGGQPPAQDPAVTAQMLKFAKCMRDHGVAMPDPSANGSSMIQQGSGIDPTDPKFKAAQTACQSLLPNGMVQGGQVHAGQGAGNP